MECIQSAIEKTIQLDEAMLIDKGNRARQFALDVKNYRMMSKEIISFLKAQIVPQVVDGEINED